MNDPEGQLRVMQGFGKFLPMAPFAPHVYEKVRAKEAEARSTTAVIRAEVRLLFFIYLLVFDVPCKTFTENCAVNSRGYLLVDKRTILSIWLRSYLFRDETLFFSR